MGGKGGWELCWGFWAGRGVGLALGPDLTPSTGRLEHKVRARPHVCSGDMDQGPEFAIEGGGVFEEKVKL